MNMKNSTVPTCGNGCTTKCKAVLHGCGSECTSMNWRRHIEGTSIQAESKSQCKRLTAQGANVVPPVATSETPETDAAVFTVRVGTAFDIGIQTRFVVDAEKARDLERRLRKALKERDGWEKDHSYVSGLFQAAERERDALKEELAAANERVKFLIRQIKNGRN